MEMSSIEPPQQTDYGYGIIAYRMLEQKLAKAKGEYDYAQRKVKALEVPAEQLLRAISFAPNI